MSEVGIVGDHNCWGVILEIKLLEITIVEGRNCRRSQLSKVRIVEGHNCRRSELSKVRIVEGHNCWGFILETFKKSLTKVHFLK